MAGISLLSGIVTLRFSPIKIFNTSVVFCLLALLLISLNYTITGITIAFLFNAVVVTFSPLIAISSNKENHLQAISGISTWWDLGAGIGVFLGIILIEHMGQQYLFLALTILITVLFTNFIIHNAKTNRTVL